MHVLIHVTMCAIAFECDCFVCHMCAYALNIRVLPDLWARWYVCVCVCACACTCAWWWAWYCAGVQRLQCTIGFLVFHHALRLAGISDMRRPDLWWWAMCSQLMYVCTGGMTLRAPHWVAPQPEKLETPTLSSRCPHSVAFVVVIIVITITLTTTIIIIDSSSSSLSSSQHDYCYYHSHPLAVIVVVVVVIYRTWLIWLHMTDSSNVFILQDLDIDFQLMLNDKTYDQLMEQLRRDVGLLERSLLKTS